MSQFEGQDKFILELLKESISQSKKDNELNFSIWMLDSKNSVLFTEFFYFWTMAFKSLQQCILDLDKKDELKKISDELSTYVNTRSFTNDDDLKFFKENIKKED